MIGKDKLGRFVKGHKSILTEESFEKIKKNNARYWLGKKHPPSEETRLKRSRALKGKARPQWVIDKIIKSQPIGSKHHNWKGGITPLRERIWHRKEYVLWRNHIFQRDNFICVLCKKRSGTLNADHFPMTFSDILKDFKIKTVQDARMCQKLWDINNGRTLCLSCHRKTETWGGRKVKK